MCVYQRVTQECITFFAFIWWQFSSKMFKKRVIQENVVWKRVQRTVCRTMTHFRKPKEDQLEGQRRHLQKTFEVKKTMVLSPKKTGCFNQKKQKMTRFWPFTSTTGSHQGPPGGQPIAAACRGPRCLLRRALRRAAPRGGGLPGRATPRGVEGGTRGKMLGKLMETSVYC